MNIQVHTILFLLGDKLSFPQRVIFKSHPRQETIPDSTLLLQTLFHFFCYVCLHLSVLVAFSSHLFTCSAPKKQPEQLRNLLKPSFHWTWHSLPLCGLLCHFLSFKHQPLCLHRLQQFKFSSSCPSSSRLLGS